MIKFISVIMALFILLLGCAQQSTKNSYNNYETKENEVNSMKLASTAFSQNGDIPSKYTCDGEGVSPPLSFSNVPAAAKSLVLIMDDPDIPDFVKEKFKINVWDHWVVLNIPADVPGAEEGKNPPGIPGKNTRGDLSYGGPCPPDKEHRYFFKLYALDAMLSLKKGASKQDVEKAMQKHIIEKAELVGRYERKR